ncbi:MAG: hypothetical protein U0X39_14705 [Bacteroidales bacterium]
MQTLQQSIKSPLKLAARNYSPLYKFVEDTERILHDVSLDNFEKCRAAGETPLSFEKAGPRNQFLF